jgi:hypothetical protein
MASAAHKRALPVPHATMGEDLTEAASLDIESRRAALKESVSMVHRTLGRYQHLAGVHEPLPWRQQITVRSTAVASDHACTSAHLSAPCPLLPSLLHAASRTAPAPSALHANMHVRRGGKMVCLEMLQAAAAAAIGSQAGAGREHACMHGAAALVALGARPGAGA